MAVEAKNIDELMQILKEKIKILNYLEELEDNSKMKNCEKIIIERKNQRRF